MDFPDLLDSLELGIQFHVVEVDFELPEEEALTAWIKSSILAEDKQLKRLNFIFCSDAYLHGLNMDYLNHDTLTDIITFPYSNSQEVIEGDIFISIERIKENALSFQVPFMQELKRVIIHGVLHLCGYKDKSKIEKEEMRAKENFYLGKA